MNEYHEHFDEQERAYIILRPAKAATWRRSASDALKIYRVSKREAEQLQEMGTAEAPDVDMCIWMASSHAKRFFKRVCGYTKELSGDPEMKIKITFYEKKAV